MKLEHCISAGNLKNVYVEGDRAIKVFDSSYNKSDVLYEALNTSRVEDTGMEIPKLLEVNVENGQWQIISQYIEGKTMAQLMKENPKNLSAYLEQMVDLQLEINSRSNPLLNKLKDKMARHINELKNIDDIKRYELLTRLDSMPKHNKLCHGDFRPENIIVTAEGKLYAVDWVHATQGNASADVAWTYLMLALESKKTADKYMACFCEKTNTSITYVLQWLPIVAAAKLTNCSEKEAKLLHQWIDVFDYQ